MRNWWTIPENAPIRRTQLCHLVCASRYPYRAQEDCKHDVDSGDCQHSTQAQNQPSWQATQDLSVPAQGRCYQPIQSSVDGRYHVCTDGERFWLSRCHHELALSQSAELAFIQHTGCRFLYPSTASCHPGLRLPGDIQHRSRRSIYRRSMDLYSAKPRHSDQHGWQRPLSW